MLSNSWFYVLWSGFVAASLIAAHATDPHLFGLAVFVLGGATGIATIAGVVFVIASPAADPRARWTVAVSSLVGVAVTLIALAVLSTFRWA